MAGSPSDEWGEVVTAWIVADGAPPSLDELAAFAAAALAPYKRPGSCPRRRRAAPQSLGQGGAEPPRASGAVRRR